MKYLDRQKLYETLLTKAGSQAKVIAVTKTHPWEECRWLFESGCRDFGESRLQEALPKISEAPQEAHWHFIGTLQKNKASKVIENFSLIHSVDSFELAEKISSLSYARPTSLLLQVNVEHKHGFKPDELLHLYPKLASLPHLNILGLMTMAPDTDDRQKITHTFRTTRQLRDTLGLKELSMGMSNDWELALDEGSTLLRIGSLLFN